MIKSQLEVPAKIWNDKRIKPEAKDIYSIIYAKGYGKPLVHINIGDFQKFIRIKNVGLRKSLKLLEKCGYLHYKEYSTGMYDIYLRR